MFRGPGGAYPSQRLAELLASGIPVHGPAILKGKASRRTDRIFSRNHPNIWSTNCLADGPLSFPIASSSKTGWW